MVKIQFYRSNQFYIINLIIFCKFTYDKKKVSKVLLLRISVIVLIVKTLKKKKC